MWDSLYTVCPSGCNYTSIQAAIEAANPGDTIEVHSGTYYENVDVNKTLILKGVDTGTGKPVVDAGGSDSAITLSADGITLVGFKATNSGSSWLYKDAGIKITSTNNTITGNEATNSDDGISLYESSSNNITGNNIRDNDDGIYLFYSSSNNITGNNIRDNNGDGIPLSHSNSNTITGNNVRDNDDGIYLSYSSHNNITGNDITNSKSRGIDFYYSCNRNIITGNNIRDNNGDGIPLSHSNSNTITGNNVRDNDDGIYLSYSSHNNITGNDITNSKSRGIDFYYSCNRNIITGNNIRDNNGDGIHLYSSSNSNIITNNIVNNNDYGIYLSSSSNSNTIINNTVSNNDYYGIYLSYSSNSNIITNNTVRDNSDDGIHLSSSSNSNIITNNTVRDNSDDGIYLSSSNNNNIYLNNFINNTDNAYSEDSTNIWNSTEEMTYTYNCSTYTNYVGNYWSDYVFAGNDTNNDGIGDTPYSIDVDNDTHPLIEHWENYFAPSEKQPTITLFSPSSPVSDIEGATRTFNVTVDQMVNVSWFINGTEVQKNTSVTSASYTNTSAVLGTWNVSAIVTNANGSDMRVWVWNVAKVTPEAPEIASYAPDTPVRDSVAATRTFNVTVNQTVNVRWQINGTEVQLNESVTEATYTNHSAANGTWTVSAVVSNANGTAIQTWIWHIEMNQAPIASFSYSPGNPVINQTIIFNASNSTDPDGNITNYKWGFGDGVHANMTEPIINHTYASAGTFTVNLTVTDNDGATNTTTGAITVSERLVFDTGTGTYPSISGTHNGTITPNVTIVVSKLYTYPCAGTGGHTEHVIIKNESGVIIAETDWDGYQIDGHNISFDVPFTLEANETYSYSIRTGSYPQIIHATSKAVAGGTINCTSFIDTNGNTYTDWIPAIRLGE